MEKKRRITNDRAQKQQTDLNVNSDTLLSDSANVENVTTELTDNESFNDSDLSDLSETEDNERVGSDIDTCVSFVDDTDNELNNELESLVPNNHPLSLFEKDTHDSNTVLYDTGDDLKTNTDYVKKSKKKGKLLEWTKELKSLKAKDKPRVVYSANLIDNNKNISATVIRPSDTVELHNLLDNIDSLESDDDEGDINRIGAVPLWWYDQHDHVGYTISGNKLTRSIDNSEITKLLRDSEDPDAWRNIVDVKNQQTMRLTDTDLEIIKRLKQGKFPLSTFDPYGLDSIVDYDNESERIHPTNSAHPPKRRFLPSLWENKRINQLVRLIREGRIRPELNRTEQVYDLWGGSITTIAADQARGRVKGPAVLPAPKQPLPNHSESYNPPVEYLFTNEERHEWENTDPELREQNFIPEKYPCLRRVPLYKNNIIERFQRCLDLYLCPRSVKMRMNVDPSSLLPQLPSPKDLRPFPTRLSLSFESNDTSSAISLSFDSTGTYLAVGRQSGTLEIYDVLLSRRLLSWTPISDLSNGSSQTSLNTVSFNPLYPILAVSHGTFLYIITLPLPAFQLNNDIDSQTPMIPTVWNSNTALNTLQLGTQGQWDKIHLDNHINGWKITHESIITNISWHSRGLYFVTVCKTASSPSQQLGIHSLTKLKTIRPFKKSGGGRIQKACFHPNKAWLFVAYFRGVRLYNLEKNTSKSSSSTPARIGGIVKKFTGVTDILDMSIHPTGDHIILGGENRRLTWFDYDLGDKPYKILRYHKAAIKTVGFHTTYPLMFSGAADGVVHIFHSKVFVDLMNSPAIIPVKKLIPANDFSLQGTTDADPIMQCLWHPSQPWLAVALKSGRIECSGQFNTSNEDKNRLLMSETTRPQHSIPINMNNELKEHRHLQIDNIAKSFDNELPLNYPSLIRGFNGNYIETLTSVVNTMIPKKLSAVNNLNDKDTHIPLNNEESDKSLLKDNVRQKETNINESSTQTTSFLPRKIQQIDPLRLPNLFKRHSSYLSTEPSVDAFENPSTELQFFDSILEHLETNSQNPNQLGINTPPSDSPGLKRPNFLENPSTLSSSPPDYNVENVMAFLSSIINKKNFLVPQETGLINPKTEQNNDLLLPENGITETPEQLLYYEWEHPREREELTHQPQISELDLGRESFIPRLSRIWDKKTQDTFLPKINSTRTNIFIPDQQILDTDSALLDSPIIRPSSSYQSIEGLQFSKNVTYPWSINNDAMTNPSSINQNNNNERQFFNGLNNAEKETVNDDTHYPLSTDNILPLNDLLPESRISNNLQFQTPKDISFYKRFIIPREFPEMETTSNSNDLNTRNKLDKKNFTTSHPILESTSLAFPKIKSSDWTTLLQTTGKLQPSQESDDVRKRPSSFPWIVDLNSATPEKAEKILLDTLDTRHPGTSSLIIPWIGNLEQLQNHSSGTTQSSSFENPWLLQLQQKDDTPTVPTITPWVDQVEQDQNELNEATPSNTIRTPWILQLPQIDKTVELPTISPWMTKPEEQDTSSTVTTLQPSVTPWILQLQQIDNILTLPTTTPTIDTIEQEQKEPDGSPPPNTIGTPWILQVQQIDNTPELPTISPWNTEPEIATTQRPAAVTPWILQLQQKDDTPTVPTIIPWVDQVEQDQNELNEGTSSNTIRTPWILQLPQIDKTVELPTISPWITKPEEQDTPSTVTTLQPASVTPWILQLQQIDDTSTLPSIPPWIHKLEQDQNDPTVPSRPSTLIIPRNTNKPVKEDTKSYPDTVVPWQSKFNQKFIFLNYTSKTPSSTNLSNQKAASNSLFFTPHVSYGSREDLTSETESQYPQYLKLTSQEQENQVPDGLKQSQTPWTWAISQILKPHDTGTKPDILSNPSKPNSLFNIDSEFPPVF